MTRLVVDTSTLVSGAVSPPTSPPAVLLDAAQAAVFDLIACPRILTEIERALKKPYFADRFTPVERTDLIETLRLLAIMLPDPADAPNVVRDGESSEQKAPDLRALADRELIERGEGTEPDGLGGLRHWHGGNVLEDGSDDVVGRYVVGGRRCKGEEHTGDVPGTVDEQRWVERFGIRVCRCIRDLVVPKRLRPKLDALVRNTLEVVADGVSRLELVEEELPVAAQQHHRRVSRASQIWPDLSGCLVVIDHDD